MSDQEQATGQTRSPDERRQAPRFDARMPLDVDGAKGKLIDMSATGVAFITEKPLEPGCSVEIGVRHLPDDMHPAPTCAEVVRVVPSEGGFAVGAKLVQRAK